MKEKFVKLSLSLSAEFICSKNILTNRFVNFPDLALSDSQVQPSPMTLTRLIDGSETHFEPVIEDQALNLNPAQPPETEQKAFWKKNSETKALKSNNSSDFPEITEPFFLLEDTLADEQRLFNILLFYLEKFSCLNAIDKNIGELEEATQTRNVDKLKQIVRNCRDECVNCEFSEALPALFVLEQVSQYSELLFAGSLINQVRAAHKKFKVRLVRNLNKIAEKRQKILQLKASAIED